MILFLAIANYPLYDVKREEIEKHLCPVCM